MSDLENEKATMGPRRWIKLCRMYGRQSRYNHALKLSPRATRIIVDLFATEVRYAATKIFIVPGGRYLVISSPDYISVLDLGYTSSANCFS